MKKLFALLFALVLLCAALPALADTEGRIYAAECHYADLKDMNAQFKGGESSDHGCMGLNPATLPDGSFADAFMQFDVTVDTAGMYAVTVQYAAKGKAGQTRCADLIVNDGERIALPIVGQADWNIYVPAKVLVHLNEGVNTLVLKNVEGFDNEVYKAINVEYLSWGLLGAATDEGQMLAVTAIGEGLKDPNPQIKGGESTPLGCIGLNPAEGQEGSLTFHIDVATGGLYNVTVQYAAKGKAGQTRCADMIVNGGERIHLPIVGQADWNVYVPATVQVELQAGCLNTIVLTNVEGFDNSAYKAINVDYVGWTPVPAE